MMKAVRKLKKGKDNVALVDVPIPKINDDEVLMKVWAAGVCRSDINIQEDTHFYTAPVTIGHEYSGIVVDVGKNVNTCKVGDKIVSDIEAPDGWLGVNLDGAYANYMKIPECVVHVCPPDMSLDAAVLVEPVVGGMLHCLQERNNINAGDFVVVVGPGPMGILAVQFAKIRGAKTVALVGRRCDEKRLEIGKKVGADYIFYSEDSPVPQIMELSNGGAEFVVDCAGTQSGTQLAIDVARPAKEGRGGRGKIALIAMWGQPITLNFDKVSMGQLDLIGGWSWNGPETWEKAIDFLYRGCIDYQSMITSRYTLEDWELAFENLRLGKDVKALIYPNGTDW
jgi:L-iditol 2-dehydrogenase